MVQSMIDQLCMYLYPCVRRTERERETDVFTKAERAAEHLLYICGQIPNFSNLKQSKKREHQTQVHEDLHGCT